MTHNANQWSDAGLARLAQAVKTDARKPPTADQCACRQAERDNLVSLVPELVAALICARAQIAEDREALFVCQRSPATGQVEDGLGRAALREYDKALSKIDTVLARTRSQR